MPRKKREIGSIKPYKKPIGQINMDFTFKKLIQWILQRVPFNRFVRLNLMAG